MSDRALCAQQADAIFFSFLFFFSIITEKSCRYFSLLAGDTPSRNLPRAVLPRSFGHPQGHDDAHAGDERLPAVA